MATAPFTAAFTDRLAEQEYAYRFNVWIGEVVHFVFHCCSDPPALGVTKPPVAVLSLHPDIVCLGDAITYDITGSYAPLGTLDRYTIGWGDGHLDDVALPGAMTGNHTYGAVGEYHVVLRVRDLLGVWGSVTVHVVVVDCDVAPALLMGRMYALSQTAGPFVRDAGDAAWTQRTAGLTGGWLLGRDLKLDPHRKHTASRHVWLATERGPAKSTTDCLFWRQLRDKLPDPDNAEGLDPAPTVDDLAFYCLAFNPMNRDEVYLLAGRVNRAWIYVSYNSGISWSSWQVNR